MKMIFKQLSAIMLSLAMIVSLAACGNSTETNSASSTQPESTSAAESASETEPDVTNTEEDEEDNASSEPETGSSILVAYFSLAGEQYQVGVIDEGNTSIISHMIAEQTGADLYEIEPTTPCPETYDGLLEISQQEMADDARPEIASSVENMDTYDTVFIGYPICTSDLDLFDAIGDTSEVTIALSESGDEMQNYDFSQFTNVEITGIDLSALTDEQLSVLYRQARYCQAMTEADTETMAELVAEDVTFTHMSGRTQTREEYFSDIEDGSLRYYTIGIENPTIEVEGDNASITYTSVLNANAYGAQGTYRMQGTHRFEKIDGEWMSTNRADQDE